MGHEATGTAPSVAYEYVWFGGRPAAQIETSAGTIHTYFVDHLGTPLLTTDATATVDWQLEREPFGKAFVNRVGSSRYQPLAFPGQEDGGPDLSYNLFRWYRTSWSRYTQDDPMLSTIRQYMVDTENVRTDLPSMIGYFGDYTYVGGGPIVFQDPNGLGIFPGFGKFKVDKNCGAKQCSKYWPLGEDAPKIGPNAGFDPPVPPGGEAFIDAVYWKNTILKVPDNCNATLVCAAGKAFMKLVCIRIPGYQPKTFVKGQSPAPPAEWPGFKTKWGHPGIEWNENGK